MSRTTTFASPLLLGFDDVERLLDRVSRTSDGYPPYNVERVAANETAPEHLRIVIAVAGFSVGEIEITVEENELCVKGRQTDETGRDYLHRGIAARQFQRTFVLADGMEVIGAALKDGLLSLDLMRPEPSRALRTIPIQSRD